MKKPKLPHPMRAAAAWLTDRLGLHERRGAGKEMNEQILLMAFGRREAVREYYIRKISTILTVTLLLAVCTVAAMVVSVRRDSAVENGRLERPDYLAESREETLSVLAEGQSEAQEVEVTISQRRYTSAQIRALLDAAQEEWEAQLLGSNASADEVRSPLVLPSSLQDGRVSASYVMIPYGIVREDGSISDEVSNEGQIVEIQATFTCQEVTRDYLLSVRALPPVLTGQAQFDKALKQSLESADETEAQLPYMTLPDEVEGRTLSWSYPKPAYLKLLPVLLLLAPIALWLLFDSRVNEHAKARREQLRLDYGELMWKMTMLTGAGLTIRGTFFKIAEEYTARGGQVRYAYEEVVRTCREMRSGVSEEKAYEQFGRRCGLSAYMRLGSVLSQNLKKGSKGLHDALEKEAVASMEERRSAARELGEKAGTRLLLPMILMLGVVVVVLVVPAFMTF